MMTTATATSVAVSAGASAPLIYDALGGVVLVTLLLMLMSKEVAGGSEARSMRRLSDYLNVGVVPLLLAYLVILVARIFAVT